jgi:hypothetical protein
MGLSRDPRLIELAKQRCRELNWHSPRNYFPLDPAQYSPITVEYSTLFDNLYNLILGFNPL